MSTNGIFHTEKIPGLSRLPKELGREERLCERCGAHTEHIFYRVPKKAFLIYIKDHPNSLHATCIACAKSIVLTGEERERVLSPD